MTLTSRDLYMPPQKWPVRFANQLAPSLISANLLPQTFDPDDLKDSARRQTGLNDFGDDSFEEPFRIITGDMSRDPDYHKVGRFFHRKVLLNFLMNRLSLAETFKKQPELAAIDVGRPLIIIGLPRTGTSHLMNLLAQDPDNRTLSFWEISRPVPAPNENTLWRDPRRYYYGAVIQLANYLVPSLRSLHNLRLDGPEECILLLSNSFRSHLFIVEYSLPTYLEWLKTCDYRPAYLEHKQQLQLLQSGIARKRWVLKAPSHMDGIEGLLDVYPDAMIVQTHRDPLKAIPSICSLSLATRSIGLKQIDPLVIGDQMVNHLDHVLHNYMEVRARRFKPGQVIDIMYDDLVRNPMATIEQIYTHFGLELTQAAQGRMAEELKANPRNKHGKHKYNLETFGLQAGELKERFSDYMRQHDIPSAA